MCLHIIYIDEHRFISGGIVMTNNSDENLLVFKALSDLNRLKIIDMLSCGELCACKLLEEFEITQPTLSHHMKVLTECGLVNGRKVGIWMHYSLNKQSFEEVIEYIKCISNKKNNCVCNTCEE